MERAGDLKHGGPEHPGVWAPPPILQQCRERAGSTPGPLQPRRLPGSLPRALPGDRAAGRGLALRKDVWVPVSLVGQALGVPSAHVAPPARSTAGIRNPLIKLHLVCIRVEIIQKPRDSAFFLIFWASKAKLKPNGGQLWGGTGRCAHLPVRPHGSCPRSPLAPPRYYSRPRPHVLWDPP